MPFVALAVAAALMNAPGPLPVDPPVTAAPAPATREITVLTYNIRGLPWPIATGRARALQAIGRELAALRAEGREPDVVLLQEGFRGEVAGLVQESGYAHWAAGPSRLTRSGDPPRFRLPSLTRLLRGEGWGKATGAGLYVLSDLPIRDVRTAAYSACAGFDCLANKGVMLARLSLADDVEVDVVNTHLNSRKASGAPHAKTLQAFRVQTDELLTFIATEAAPDRPLLVGGDFNVRNAPDRYDYRADTRPYRVVSEFCHATPGSCGSSAASGPRPWLGSQDLQAFAGTRTVDVRPIGVAPLFDGQGAGRRLSDHNGYLVRYRIAWTAPTASAASSPRSPGPAD